MVTLNIFVPCAVGRWPVGWLLGCWLWLAGVLALAVDFACGW